MDLTGRVFSRLTVVKQAGRNKRKKVKWLCSCECGQEKIVDAHNLVSENTRSCGCLHREWMPQLHRLVKQDNPISSTREYKSRKQKEWMQNPKIRMTRRIRWGMWAALRDLGSPKKRKTFEMLGYSAADLVTHIERQFLPGMSWENQGDWHLDHIVPVSSAKTVEDLIHLNQLSNLRPLWGAENKSKGAKRTHLI